MVTNREKEGDLLIIIAVRRAHPFALGWDDLQNGVADSIKAGSFRLSERAFFLLDSMNFLRSLKKFSKNHSIFKKLENGPQYFSTIFEVSMFVAYRSMGIPILFLEESSISGERRPDFLSEFGETRVFLECKSLQDKYDLEDRVWLNIEDRLSSLMARHDASYHITLLANRPLAGKDIKPIIDAASQMINSYSGPATFAVMDCNLQILRILEPREIAKQPINLQQRNKGRIRVEMGWYGHVGDVEKLAILESVPFFDYMQEKALVRLLRDAADQLPKDNPGVVHLQVPYRIPTMFMDVVDHARPFIEKELQRHCHVCAVVITGRFLKKKIVQRGDPISTSVAVLPNFSSSYMLPKHFRLFGSCDFNDFQRRFGVPEPQVQTRQPFLIGAVRTIMLEFGIYTPFAEQSGLYLCRHCSMDGREQLNVWQTYRSLFRIEIIEEVFGRRTLDFDLNHLAVGVTHRMVFTWDENGIRCAVNGAMVAS